MANPLDTDAGTELFKHYETEYQLVQADLVQKLDQIVEMSGEPRKAAMSAAERALEETGELLDQMQMEKQNVPSSQRGAINRRLRDYKTDVDGYRRKLRTLAEDRSALFGGRYTDNPGSSSGDAHFEQRQQLLSGESVFFLALAWSAVLTWLKGRTGWIAAHSVSRPARRWRMRPRPSEPTLLRSWFSSVMLSITPPGSCTRARVTLTVASRALRGSLVGMTFFVAAPVRECGMC